VIYLEELLFLVEAAVECGLCDNDSSELLIKFIESHRHISAEVLHKILREEIEQLQTQEITGGKIPGDWLLKRVKKRVCIADQTTTHQHPVQEGAIGSERETSMGG